MYKAANDTKEPIVTLYKATNMVNGRFYIGITNRQLRHRKWKHVCSSNAGSNLKFHRAIKKHGKENFSFEPMWYLSSYKEALDEESRLIRILRPEYNLTAGGGGIFGHKMSEEAKKKMSSAKKGRPSLNKGKKWPQEMKNKISGTLKEKYKSGEIKSDISVMVAARRKKIICLNDGLQFDSSTSAALYYGLLPGAPARVARGERKSIKGLFFKWGPNVDK